MPKLIRWGIDLHMGVLFGLPNQILMALIAFGLMVTIVYGYVLWWGRKPVAAEPLSLAWTRLSPRSRLVWVLLACVLGWALPMPSFSLALALFLIIDIRRAMLVRRTG